MSKGILTYALGDINYYQMAVALAASIRANDPGLQICLVTDRSVLPEHGFLFDKIIFLESSDNKISQNREPCFIKAKLFMFELTPFTETIFLDADQILLIGKKLSPVFTELQALDFTMSNTGVAGESVWADISEVKKLYGDKPFWNFHSEFMYFKKVPAVKQYFKAALRAWDDNKIKSATKFAGARMADELAFQVASIITGMYPHKKNWSPNFWFSREEKLWRKYSYELQGFLTYSIGGKSIPAIVKNNYNNLVAYYFHKMKLQNPYKLIEKQNFSPDRQNF